MANNKYGSVPATVITKLQVATELLELSIAVYVTVVAPIEKSSPELWSDDSVTMPELSEAVGSVHVAVPVIAPMSVSTVWSLGHPLIIGSSLSVKYLYVGKDLLVPELFDVRMFALSNPLMSKLCFYCNDISEINHL